MPVADGPCNGARPLQCQLPDGRPVLSKVIPANPKCHHPESVAGWIFTIGCYAAYMNGRGYQVSRYRQATEQMVSLAHGHKIYTLTNDEPWLGVLYYANQIMPGISIERLAQIAGENNRAIFLLTFDGKSERVRLDQIAVLAHRHWRILDRVNDGHAVQTLFELLPVHHGAPFTAAVPH